MAATIKEAPAVTRTVELKFRWKYILLPVIVLFICVILFAIFYWQLSPQVAYRFDTDGSPTNTVSREMLALFMLLPQLLFVLLAGIVTSTIIRIGGSLGEVSQALNPERIILLIGNIVVLPQVVFGFIMLDVFSYNVNNSHLIPVWLFAIIVMAIGGAILTLFFIRTFMHSRKVG
jgi:uncharacterized membrane protein